MECPSGAARASAAQCHLRSGRACQPLPSSCAADTWSRCPAPTRRRCSLGIHRVSRPGARCRSLREPPLHDPPPDSSSPLGTRWEGLGSTTGPPRCREVRSPRRRCSRPRPAQTRTSPSTPAGYRPEPECPSCCR
ncbi:hypothetical protein OAK19_06490 [Aureispira]|nr:hypothetical protein [Aureispira sp.]